MDEVSQELYKRQPFNTREYRYHLVVAEGSYSANTLVGLLWSVFAHRCRHLFHGQGWRD